MRNLLVLLFSGVSTAALAQQHTPIVEQTDEVVIVRAAPLAHVRDEILQGVTVLDREAVLANLGQGLGDTLDRQPGVSSTAFGAGASRPIIRGLGEDRIRVLSNGLAQIDASSISPDHAVPAEGLEAERIEILRGPAALAYGSTAVGGVVNVVDGVIAERTPERALSGRAYGDYTIGLRGGQGAGQLEAAFGENIVFNAQGFRRNFSDFVVPDFVFSEGLREELIAEALEEGEAAPEFDRNRAPNSQSDAALYDFGLSFVGRVFGRQAFAGASFQRFTSVYGIPEGPGGHGHGEEEEGEEEEIEIFPGAFIDLASNRYEARAGIRDVGFLDEIRANVAVVNYEHSEIEPSGEVGTLFENDGVNARLEVSHKPVAGFTGVGGFEGLVTDFAASGEEAFITPTVTRDFAGFWIERYERGALGIEGGLRYARNTVDNVVFGAREFDLLNGSLGVSYRPAPGLFLGLQGSRTERAPTQTELFSLGAHLATASFDVGDPTLGEERVWSVEGSVRYGRGRLRLEAHAFANFFDGFIAFVPTGAEEDDLPVFLYTQQDARFVGGEFLAAYDLIRRGALFLTVDGQLDVVRARFTDEGGSLPRIPPLSTRLGLEGGVDWLNLRLEWERANDQDRTATFEDPTAGFDLFNARLNYKPIKSAPLRFLIDGRNLTNEEARVATSFVNDLLPRPGRTVRLGAILEF